MNMSLTEKELCRALQAGELIPFFQPLVDLRTGQLQGFEILARWHRLQPEPMMVSPAEFIPLIERYRLMNTLLTSQLTQAFATARTLPQDFGLSVNLSPSQLHDRSIPGLIHKMADEAEFDLRRLTIELTETALVDDLDLARKVAQDFKRLGIRLSLDDFGTGYSSLLHLQSLPFDEIKVDIEFVRSMVQSRQSRKITAAVISLGLSLGLDTVGEGIEEANQSSLLAWQGCKLGQGYLFGRPAPASTLPALLEQRQLAAERTPDVPASVTGTYMVLDAQPTQRPSPSRALYDSAPIGLAYINTEFRYLNLNQQLARINGLSVQAHLGRKVSDLVEPKAYALFEPDLKRALAGESIANTEVRRFNPAGEIVKTLLVSYQPVRGEGGEILGVSVSLVDITDLREQERRDKEEQFATERPRELSAVFSRHTHHAA